MLYYYNNYYYCINLLGIYFYIYYAYSLSCIDLLN